MPIDHQINRQPTATELFDYKVAKLGIFQMHNDL